VVESQAWPAEFLAISRILLLASDLGGRSDNEPPLKCGYVVPMMGLMELSGEVCSGSIPHRATHCSHPLVVTFGYF